MTNYKTPKQPLLKDWQVEAIRRRAAEVLRLRCFPVTGLTLKLVEYDSKGKQEKQLLEFDSDPFNTVPVIHSELRIDSFGTSVYKSTRMLDDADEEIDIIKFYVDVHVRYEGNGVSLFTISGEVQDRHSDMIFFNDDKHGHLFISRKSDIVS